MKGKGQPSTIREALFLLSLLPAGTYPGFQVERPAPLCFVSWEADGRSYTLPLWERKRKAPAPTSLSVFWITIPLSPNSLEAFAERVFSYIDSLSEEERASLLASILGARGGPPHADLGAVYVAETV